MSDLKISVPVNQSEEELLQFIRMHHQNLALVRAVLKDHKENQYEYNSYSVGLCVEKCPPPAIRREFIEYWIEEIEELKKELYVIFWISEEDDARQSFEAGAKTRVKNIKNAKWYKASKHKVYMVSLTALHMIGVIIENLTNIHGGPEIIQTKEVGIFCHCGGDGPITYQTICEPPIVSWSHQMHLDKGWGKINFNWITDRPKFVVYGCNSGAYGFMNRLSQKNNCINVEMWGQMDFTAPSFLPDYRATTLARSWNMSTGWSVRETYYIGTPRKTGMQAHISESWIKAIPFDIFQDGIRRYSSHQGVFNDHRKNS